LRGFTRQNTTRYYNKGEQKSSFGVKIHFIKPGREKTGGLLETKDFYETGGSDRQTFDIGIKKQ